MTEQWFVFDEDAAARGGEPALVGPFENQQAAESFKNNEMPWVFSPVLEARTSAQQIEEANA